jgi:protein-S-isoprenylcysteine O-methyltransferase Ste14
MCSPHARNCLVLLVAEEMKMNDARVNSSQKSWSVIARRIRVPLSFACAVLYFWLAHPSLMSIFAGTLIIIPGLVVRALASGHVKKNEELATSGPYAYTRNPLYLGSLILAFGFVLAARSWWIAGVLLTMFFGIYLPVIYAEESFLRQRFPDYEAYESKVPRLLPKISAPNHGDVKFSWELYSKHREYNALIGAIAMIALLLIKMYWRSK